MRYATFADVIVDAPADPTKKFFTYLVSENLKSQAAVGQYVQVPWGQKLARGVIWNLKNKSELKELKPISKILIPQPVLKDFQIKLLSWLSWYYAAPMIDCLKAILPDFPANLEKVKLDQTPIKAQQKLILVPTLSQLPQALTQVKSKTSYLVYHHDLPKLKRFALWQQIYNGEVETIIGLRSAVFAPFTNLAKILLINEHDQAYKDERSPYYHTFTVAARLAQLTGCKLTVEDSTPSVELFYINKSGNLGEKFTLKQPKVKPVLSFRIVERKLGNYSLISQVLANQLIYIYKKKLGPVLLYLNRKSEAGSIFCRSCKQTVFAVHEPENCPQCQSVDIVIFSTNLGKVANDLRKLIPNLEFELVTEDHPGPIPTKPVTITTSAVFSKPIIAQFAQVAVISADTSLHLADFRSQEATFQFLWTLTLLPYKKIEHLPQLIVQTYNPQLPVIKYALTHDYHNFYQTEMAERRIWSYSPFGKLVKLTISHKNPAKSAQLAQNLYDELTMIDQDKVEITDPFQSFFRLPQKSKWNIILKAKKRNDLDLIFAKVPNDWSINVDPKDLL